MNDFVRYASFEEMMLTLKSVVSSGGSMSFVPAGRSMFPTIRDRKDTVTISAPTNIKKYDIVLYRRRNGKFVLHRIVRVLDDNAYIMCGDAQFMLEYPVEKEYIIGKVSRIKRGKLIIDCESLNFFEKAYVHLWDKRLVLDKALYDYKRIKAKCAGFLK